MKKAFRFVHALPNAWLPTPDKNLVISGISATELRDRVKGHEVTSHVRYDDHAKRISIELGIKLESSGVNAPSPFSCDDVLIVASLTPGTTTISYVVVWDSTAILNEAGVIA